MHPESIADKRCTGTTGTDPKSGAPIVCANPLIYIHGNGFVCNREGCSEKGVWK
jgi:hypothetical protein